MTRLLWSRRIGRHRFALTTLERRAELRQWFSVSPVLKASDSSTPVGGFSVVGPRRGVVFSWWTPA